MGATIHNAAGGNVGAMKGLLIDIVCVFVCVCVCVCVSVHTHTHTNIYRLGATIQSAAGDNVGAMTGLLIVMYTVAKIVAQLLQSANDVVFRSRVYGV